LGRYGGKSPATVAKFFQKIIGTYRICQRLTPNQHTREGHGSIPNNRYIQIHTTETSMISPPPPYERKESNKKIKAQQSKAQSRGAVRRPPSTRSLAGTPRFAAIRPAARHQGSRDVAEGRHVRCSGRAGSRRRLGMDGPPPSLFLSGNRCRRGRPPRWWRRTGGLRLQLFRKPSIFICISSRLRIEIERDPAKTIRRDPF